MSLWDPHTHGQFGPKGHGYQDLHRGRFGLLYKKFRMVLEIFCVSFKVFLSMKVHGSFMLPWQPYNSMGFMLPWQPEFQSIHPKNLKQTFHQPNDALHIGLNAW